MTVKTYPTEEARSSRISSPSLCPLENDVIVLKAGFPSLLYPTPAILICGAGAGAGFHIFSHHLSLITASHTKSSYRRAFCYFEFLHIPDGDYQHDLHVNGRDRHKGN